MRDQQSFQSDAWLNCGWEVTAPGLLRLDDGRLTFSSEDAHYLWDAHLRKLEAKSGQPDLMTRVRNKENVTIIDVNVKDAVFIWPWYYFSGGMKVKIGDAVFKFSFGRPPKGRSPSRRNNPISNISMAADEFSTVASMRKVGKTWRSLLPDGN